MQDLRQWLREPLIHFLGLGALLFAGYGLINDDPPAAAESVIRITQGDVQRLTDAWQKQWGRTPTRSELDGLMDELIREEVLYREALALGLDQDDTIIRRRLAQKMEFITEDLATAAAPDEASLRAFYASNAERFAEPATRSFRHIYFNADQRGESASAAAATALEQLASGADPDMLGDRFMLESTYLEMDEQATARLFGTEFAASVFALDGTGWQGPIASGYGLHLVEVTDRNAERIPELDEVADKVLAEYRYEQREQANQRVFESLKSRYEIRIDGAAG